MVKNFSCQVNIIATEVSVSKCKIVLNKRRMNSKNFCTGKSLHEQLALMKDGFESFSTVRPAVKNTFGSYWEIN